MSRDWGVILVYFGVLHEIQSPLLSAVCHKGSHIMGDTKPNENWCNVYNSSEVSSVKHVFYTTHIRTP